MDKIELKPQDINKIKTGIQNKIDNFKNCKVMVIGDIGLDEYIHGSVKRISPEAPVPVLNVKTTEYRLGLAANVAQNITSLQGHCTLVSVTGKDDNHDKIKSLCENHNITTKFILDSSRPTTVKTRVLHDSHHIVRIDHELKEFISSDLQTQILEAVKESLESFDVVIIEDYNKGVISENVAQKIIQLANEANIPVLVDPHLTTPAEFYKGAYLLKPNINEVYALLKISQNSILDKSVNHFTLAKALKDQLNLKEVLLTLGKDGMAIYTDNKLVHFPTLAKQVYDVTGAGDTVIAVLGLAKASGLDLVESSYLANIAAGIVVSKVGTVSCKYEDLLKQV